MYLEISNIAAACGKNPYEPREKMLLTSWARHCPEIVKEYLIENKCFEPLVGEEYSEIQKQVYKMYYQKNLIQKILIIFKRKLFKNIKK